MPQPDTVLRWRETDPPPHAAAAGCFFPALGDQPVLHDEAWRFARVVGPQLAAAFEVLLGRVGDPVRRMVLMGSPEVREGG